MRTVQRRKQNAICTGPKVVTYESSRSDTCKRRALSRKNIRFQRLLVIQKETSARINTDIFADENGPPILCGTLLRFFFFGDENALVAPLSRWQTRPIELTWLHSSFGRAIEAASPSVGRSAPIRGTRMCANDLHRQSDAVRISRHLEPAPPAVPWCRNRVTMDPLYVGRGQWTWAACEQQPAQYHYPVGHQSAEFRAKPQSRDIE